MQAACLVQAARLVTCSACTFKGPQPAKAAAAELWGKGTPSGTAGRAASGLKKRGSEPCLPSRRELEPSLGDPALSKFCPPCMNSPVSPSSRLLYFQLCSVCAPFVRICLYCCMANLVLWAAASSQPCSRSLHALFCRDWRCAKHGTERAVKSGSLLDCHVYA